MKIIFYTPTFMPAGGVIKIFDYINHALSLGYAIDVVCPEKVCQTLPLFKMDNFYRLIDNSSVSFLSLNEASIFLDDIVFFSLPVDFKHIEKKLPSGFSRDRIIHIIQNVRHGNINWLSGYGTKLLPKFMSRIFINDLVKSACQPYLVSAHPSRVINLGHDIDYFSHKRKNILNNKKIRVGYTTWKSDLGVKVEEYFDNNSNFEFKSIRTPVDWNALKSLYTNIDIFIASPDPEEGFYLPGLEAMACGALVLCPNVGGNMAYMKFGVNALQVGFENLNSYIEQLEHVATNRCEYIKYIEHGYRTSSRFSLENEAKAFKGFLNNLNEPL
jgi:glycosyltransferase involved in cell wall biosynthesis